jgi:putative ABC transport system ATP-binding protein
MDEQFGGVKINQAPQEPMAKLIWSEDNENKEQLLDRNELTIGRAPESNIFLKDQRASRYHCVILTKPEGYLVMDLDSANGTYVNGERVHESHELHIGDKLVIGQVEFRIELIPQEPTRISSAIVTHRIVWEQQGQKIARAIGSEGLTFGRNSENDIVLKDLAVSRAHSKIVPQADGFALVDLDSTNGTFLNNQRVTDAHLLSNGDRLRIGHIEFRFETLVQEPTTIRLPEEEAVIEFPVPEAPKPIEVRGPVVVDIKEVIKDYDTPGGTVRILKGINLQVHAGEFVGIRGPSGSGKSTLLNMVTGIDRATSGEVIVSGQSITKLNENKMARWRGEHIGVIFQFFQLLPTLTIIENVMLPMDFCRKWKPRERIERAMELLRKVELTEHANKLPSALSGGQQQRAAIARALSNDPPVIVADEPTGNLDSKTADRIFSLFEELVAQGTTFLMVTHDIELAKRFPRVIEVLDGELHENRSGDNR